MTLRWKALLITGSTLAGLVAVLYLSLSVILTRSSARLEEQDVRDNVDRAPGTLLDEFTRLDYFTRDWAWWDDTYAYVEDRNEDYVQSTLNDASIEGLKLSLHPLNRSLATADSQAVMPPLSSEAGSILVRPSSEDTVAGYTLVRDIYGQPALLLQVDVPRVIHKQGQSSLHYVVGALLACGLAFTAVTLLLLEKLVLVRITRLSTAVSRIGTTGDFHQRLDLVGELEQFAYVASHDLQEPLRMVATFTQLLARRNRGKLDADSDEYISYAIGGVTRMQTLINDLLDHSRVGSRGQPFRPACCHTVLENALANLRVAIEQSGAVVTPGPLPRVVGDATQLTQLFQNLIGSSTRFRRDDPPRVHVAAERRDGARLISARDNGIGIERQYCERIFLPFQRLHPRGQYPGSGIGLAVCKRIVERHGGRKWVESQPGEGSTFFFTIPDNGVGES